MKKALGEKWLRNRHLNMRLRKLSAIMRGVYSIMFELQEGKFAEVKNRD